jgi:hypothetical protein
MKPTHTKPTQTKPSRRTRTSVLAFAVLASLIGAACGGGDDDSSATTTEAPATTDAPTTTAAPTTTEADAPTTTARATTTTAPAEPVMPLTGMPIEDEALATRPAMVVKIDNHPEARPQYGLNAADIVFEENVENLTRFAAVFQSQDAPDRVGPIRSGRTQDIALLGSLNQPLFVWSGGNANVTKAIRDSDLVELSPSSTKNHNFFRDNSRGVHSEHTLFAHMDGMYTEFTPAGAPAPQQQFTYRAAGEAFNGDDASGVDLKMDGVKVNWTWDAGSTSYLRSQGGKPHQDATLGQVSAANVVVLEVDYKPSPADARSPEAQTIGTGTAWVFTGGVMIEGTWERDDRLEIFQLKDASGSAIALTPGRTWVELARVDTVTPIA